MVFESLDCAASQATSEVLEEYEGILAKATEAEARNVKATWSLKLEQLKGEVAQLDHTHD